MSGAQFAWNRINLVKPAQLNSNLRALVCTMPCLPKPGKTRQRTTMRNSNWIIWGYDDTDTTNSEDRATQPMDDRGWVSQKQQKYIKMSALLCPLPSLFFSLPTIISVFWVFVFIWCVINTKWAKKLNITNMRQGLNSWVSWARCARGHTLKMNRNSVTTMKISLNQEKPLTVTENHECIVFTLNYIDWLWSLRISKNSKDCREGYWKGCAVGFRAYIQCSGWYWLSIKRNLNCRWLPYTATDYQRQPQSQTAAATASISIK